MGFVVAVTSRSTGSFAVDGAGVEERRSAVAGGLPVAWLRQVHGDAVTSIGPGDPIAGLPCDATTTDRAGLALSVITADCAPIALWTDAGSLGVVHAGWRGLVAGVIERTVAALRQDRPLAPMHALLGPQIHPCCYEFGPIELDRVARAYGDHVRATTRAGHSALDLPMAVSVALERCGVTTHACPALDVCTACDGRYYSWRANRDVGRQAMLIWRQP